MKYDKLKVGDIIVVSNPLGTREYSVLKIEGNRAITKFRTFNTRIYPPNMIYEFGKRDTPWGNGYWVKGYNPTERSEG